MITEHAIVPLELIGAVTVTRTTPKHSSNPVEKYSIVGHTLDGKEVFLYVDLAHSDITAKMLIIAGQMNKPSPN